MRVDLQADGLTHRERLGVDVDGLACRWRGQWVCVRADGRGAERVGVCADGPQRLGSVAVKMRILYGLMFLRGLVNVVIVVIVWACGWVWMAREVVVYTDGLACRWRGQWVCVRVDGRGVERVGVCVDGPQRLGSVAVKMRILYGLTFLRGLVNVVVVVWACGWVWMAREVVVSVILRADTVRDG